MNKDEMIRKLKKALQQIDNAQPDCPSPACDILSNAGMNIDFVLDALLESLKAEQSPAGEFTKALRNLANCALYDYFPQEKKCLYDAAARLDAQQQEIEKLKTENNRFREEDGWKDIVHNQTNAITKLTAENKAQAEEIDKLKKYAAGIEADGTEPYKDMIMDIRAAFGNRANNPSISDADLLRQI